MRRAILVLATLLAACGGAGDEGAPAANRARVAPTAPVSFLDIDSAASGSEPFDDLKGKFALAKDLIAAAAVAQGATDGGARAVLEAYHTTLVAPFCLAAASRFFAAQ